MGGCQERQEIKGGEKGKRNKGDVWAVISHRVRDRAELKSGAKNKDKTE